MRHFFTKLTVEASIYCKACGKDTVWKIAGGRPQYCTACYAQPKKPPPRREKPPETGNLFS